MSCDHATRAWSRVGHDLAIVWNLGAVAAVDSVSRYLEWASSGMVLRPLRS